MKRAFSSFFSGGSSRGRASSCRVVALSCLAALAALVAGCLNPRPEELPSADYLPGEGITPNDPGRPPSPDPQPVPGGLGSDDDQPGESDEEPGVEGAGGAGAGSPGDAGAADAGVQALDTATDPDGPESSAGDEPE